MADNVADLTPEDVDSLVDQAVENAATTSENTPTATELAAVPMKKAYVDGEFRSAYAKKLHLLDRVDPTGKKLPRFPVGTELKYGPHAYFEFVNIEQVRAQGKYPSDKDIVKMLNVDARAAARQAGMKVAQDAAFLVAPTAENDPDMRLKQYYNGFINATNKKTGKLHTPEEAWAKARRAMELEDE